MNPEIKVQVVDSKEEISLDQKLRLFIHSQEYKSAEEKKLLEMDPEEMELELKGNLWAQVMWTKRVSELMRKDGNGDNEKRHGIVYWSDFLGGDIVGMPCHGMHSAAKRFNRVFGLTFGVYHFKQDEFQAQLDTLIVKPNLAWGLDRQSFFPMETMPKVILKELIGFKHETHGHNEIAASLIKGYVPDVAWEGVLKASGKE